MTHRFHSSVQNVLIVSETEMEQRVNVALHATGNDYCDAACCTFEETVCWTLDIFKTATVRAAPTAAVNRRPVPHAMPRPAVIQMALAVVKPLTSPSMSVGLCIARFPFPAVVMTFGGIRGRGDGARRAPTVDLGRR